jgi:hypothetical protein
MDDLEIYLIEDSKSEKIKSERAITHYISTPAIDRGKDIVNPKGMDSTDFEKTKTVFYNHNYDKPIAKNLWVKRTDDGVKVKTVFSETPFANDIYTLHLEDIIKTWSIGFDIPRKSGRYSEPVDGAITLDDKSGIRTINKWILLEYSSAPLAMNPNALDIAKNIKSFMKTDEIKSVIEMFEYKSEIQIILDNQKTEIESLKTLIENSKNENSNTEIENIVKEIVEIKSNLAKRAAESLDNRKRISAIDIQKMVIRELSELTGVRL